MTRPASSSVSRVSGHQQTIRLTDEQALAAAAEDQFVNIVSVPGSGKTTVAAERFGYERYGRTDARGVLGLSFTRSAAAELNARIVSRWGSGCVAFLHWVSTFDELHVRLFQLLLDKSIDGSTIFIVR
jgi:DNA helicase II / ATP-dependent DNA helicase PcrA